jgi:hypothetical protein
MNGASIAQHGGVHGAHGLRVGSEERLPGLPVAMSADNVDVDLRWDPPDLVSAYAPPGDVLLAFEFRGQLRYAAAFDGEVYRLRFANCCEFTIARDLGTVRCRPDPAVDRALTCVLAEGSLMAFLLAMMQRCVLHASAVEVGEAAVAVVGASGFGKSTVAAMLCASGCPLVTDDVLRIDLSDDPVVFAGAHELRLRPAARDIAGQFPGPVRTRETADGRLALRPQRTERLCLPLRAMVIPRPRRDCDHLAVAQLSRVQAMSHLVAFPRLLGWQSALALQQQFGMLGKLVQRVPVFEADVPWGPPFDPRLGRDLVDTIFGDLSALPAKDDGDGSGAATGSSIRPSRTRA